jgi:hypothetical protein
MPPNPIHSSRVTDSNGRLGMVTRCEHPVAGRCFFWYRSIRPIGDNSDKPHGIAPDKVLSPKLTMTQVCLFEARSAPLIRRRIHR